jgi:hypothetical protein
MGEKLLKTGKGWRMGCDRAALTYQGLVGGDGWAIELTESEFKDFCRLLTQLANTLQQMTEVLMEEEKIACEAESDLLWMEVEGYPHAYCLRFMLHQGRRGEGYWPAEAVPGLVQTAQMFYEASDRAIFFI